MALTDEEARHLLISLLRRESARDRQKRVGASDLANQCDYCLACALSGKSRKTALTDRAWLRRKVGTAMHEFAARQAADTYGVTEAHIERRVRLGSLGSYGEVFSTPDFVLLGEDHLFDFKTTTDVKSVHMRDAIRIANGLDPIFGRESKYIPVYTKNEKSGLFRKAVPGLSEKVYSDEIEYALFVIQGYMAQTNLYAHAKIAEGHNIRRITLGMISVDNSGWFDNPDADDYDNEERMRGVWVLSFDPDAAFTDAVWQRALSIWEALEAGTPLSDFAHHPLCFPCGLDHREETARERVEDFEISLAS